MKLRKPSQAQEMTAAQVRQSLVEDFVTGVNTPLPAFIAGIKRLAEVHRISEEAAYHEVRNEARALGGKGSQFDG